MYISWQWIKERTNFISESSLTQVVDKLNYLGLECEAHPAHDEIDSFINFTTASNRRDLKSWWGIQREITILLGIESKQIAFEKVATNQTQQSLVKITSPQVISYNFLVLELNDSLMETPTTIAAWLVRNQIKLVSPLVDIVNFVTLETGQPLHIYDLAKIPNLSATNPITVQQLASDAKFRDLHNTEHQLLKGDLVVSANQEVICLAGIIGSAQTAVDKSTSRVLIEAADFDSELVANSAQRIMTTTRASEIFRKKLNQESPATALERVAEMFKQQFGANCEIITREISQFRKPAKTITITHQLVEKVFGAKIAEREILAILGRLQFKHQLVDGCYVVDIPTFRTDITIEEDLVEEIGKLFDYNNLPGRTSLVRNHFVDRKTNFKYELKKKLSTYLNSWGYQEVISYSLIDKTAGHDESFIAVNSGSNNRALYRKSFLTSHLKILNENLKQQNEDLSLFEIGSIFSRQAGSIVEEEIISLLSAGLMLKSDLHKLYEAKDFYWLKGIIENILVISGLTEYRFSNEQSSCLDPQQTVQVWVGAVNVGFFGRVSPEFLVSNQISTKNCFFAQLAIARILELSFQSNEQSFSAVSYLPVIKKDISFVVAKTVKIDDILSLISENGGSFFHEAILFDRYQKSSQDNQHSLAFRLSFQGKENNLHNKEIESYIANILNCLRKEFSIKER